MKERKYFVDNIRPYLPYLRNCTKDTGNQVLIWSNSRLRIPSKENSTDGGRQIFLFVKYS